MKGTYGRVDYHPRLHHWAAMGYIKGKRGGVKEIKVGCASTKGTAYEILDSWYLNTPKHFVAYT